MDSEWNPCRACFHKVPLLVCYKYRRDKTNRKIARHSNSLCRHLGAFWSLFMKLTREMKQVSQYSDILEASLLHSFQNFLGQHSIQVCHRSIKSQNREISYLPLHANKRLRDTLLVLALSTARPRNVKRKKKKRADIAFFSCVWTSVSKASDACMRLGTKIKYHPVAGTLKEVSF